jgi:putative ABC transport system permease protein
VLSQSAARKLKVAVGDQIDGSLNRRHNSQSERVHVKLKVVGITHLAAFARDGAFVPLDLIVAAEDFLDGRAVPALDWQGDSPLGSGRSFPGFRLYANSINDVAALRDGLIANGIEVRTRAADIDIVQTMEKRLSAVFWFVAVIGLTGFSFSLGANLWANVDRKKKELSVLRLVGFRTSDIVWFPVLQALLTGVLGWALASLIYLGVETSINRMLIAQIEDDSPVCRLLPLHFEIALVFTVGAAVLAAALGGYRAARIQPSDGLREI